ncbi:DUF2963 domain-containing protein [Candidatus Phytoplasma solani]
MIIIINKKPKNIIIGAAIMFVIFIVFIIYYCTLYWYSYCYFAPFKKIFSQDDAPVQKDAKDNTPVKKIFYQDDGKTIKIISEFDKITDKEIKKTF